MQAETHQGRPIVPNRKKRPYAGSGQKIERGAAVLMFATADRKLAPTGFERYEGSGNRKMRPIAIGPFVCATYVSIASTCPDSCVFKNDGCYASEGFTRRTFMRLDAKERTGLEVMQDEADLIGRAFSHRRRRVPQDGARGGRDLRLHVGGDVSCAAGARLLAAAALDWQQRGGGAVWTFTHRWREIPRSAWGRIAILASVETPDEARLARARCYAPAMVVREFPIKGRAFDIGGTKFIPCPAETRGRNCANCRLCLEPARLGENGVAFAAHGHDKGVRASRHLPVLG